MASIQSSRESNSILAPQAYRTLSEELVMQSLKWGDLQSSHSAPADTMFTNTGRCLYVVGDVDGGFRPRSNPYDLYNFGAALATDPLANKLQGVWAQPVKALNAYSFVVQANGDTWPLLNAKRFTQSFAEAEFAFESENLNATRTDFAPQDRPILFTSLKIRNNSAKTIELRVAFFAYFDLEDAWFTSLAEQRNQGEFVTASQNCLIAHANASKDWAVVVSGNRPDALGSVRNGSDNHPIGQLEFTAQLESEGELEWTIAIVVEIESGVETARQKLRDWLPQKDLLLSEKQALYETLLVSGPRFHSSDSRLDFAFDLARGNLQMLEAESAQLGRYFYAGLENFPFWFSPDGSYNSIALLATGLVAPTLNHLRIGALASQDGRIPHQISPSGKITAVGNAQESPHWIIGLWDAYRWTGNDAFLAELYPAAVTSLFDYTLGTNNLDGDGYPSGAGIVEHDDMGPKKLDTASYTWAALRAIAEIADVLGDTDTALRSRSRAERLAADFDAVWWDATNGTYAMSLASDLRQVPVAHWAVVVPLEVGLATPMHAATTLATLEKKYLNAWGLKHTVGTDERVWTLPTSLLSQAAYRYKQAKLGFEMLCKLSETINHGSIGMYHELIPEGLCFVQLWSAAQFVRGIIENLMGVDVQAYLHTIILTPHLPEDWDFAELENLRFASHLISLRVSRETVTIRHIDGAAALMIVCRSFDSNERRETVEVGEKIVVDTR